MKAVFFALLLVVTSNMPSLAGTTAREYPGWKSAERFEISKIDGYQEAYNGQVPVVLYLEGKSDQMSIEPSNGFFTSAILYDIPRTGIQNAIVKYDQTRHAWRIALNAPRDNTKTYEIQVHLYCGKEGSACTATYGLSAQKEKIMPLNIRQ